MLVSPRLREALTERPGLAGLVPGRLTGTIGPDGLTGPHELYSYIGRSPGQLPYSARPLGGFGSAWTPAPAVDSSTLDILRFTLTCVALLPLAVLLAVFLSVCARLSAEARARRLAALRLLGLGVKEPCGSTPWRRWPLPSSERCSASPCMRWPTKRWLGSDCPVSSGIRPTGGPLLPSSPAAYSLTRS